MKMKIKIEKTENVFEEKELDLPIIGIESDVQATIDIMTIHVKTEHAIAKELGFNLQDIHEEMIRLKNDPDLRPSEEFKSWNYLVSRKSNFEIVAYLLQKADPLITHEQVSRLGNLKINEIILAVFQKNEDLDFQKATPEVAESSPVTSS